MYVVAEPSGPPQHVMCEPMTSSILLITWSPPPAKLANGVITGYRVAYGVHTDTGEAC